MSQRHHAPNSASRSPSDDGRRITLPPVKTRNDGQQRTDLLEWQLPISDQRLRDSQSQLLHSRSFRPKVHGMDRDLGVHSILNPDVTLSNQSPARHHSENEPMIMNSSSRPRTSSQRIFSDPQLLTSSILSTTDSKCGNLSWMTRPMLTPKSPSRAVNSSKMATPVTLDPEGSPPLSSLSKQIQTLEPNLATSLESSLNPSSSLAGQQTPKQRFGKNYPKSTHVGIPGSLNLQPLTGTPMSKISSPSASTTSSYNPQTNQNSPGSIINQSGQVSPSNTYYHPGSSLGNSMQLVGSIHGPHGNPEGLYNPPDNSQNSNNAGISRQTSATDSIQVLTITTNQGLYTIPVDVHHASRVADEKRARNAGASARFRRRRKEKEIEANLAIEKLQSQVKDLERSLENLQSERDFYRSERDRLRDIMLRTSETRYYAIQTPRSPPERNRSFAGHLENFASSQQSVIGQSDVVDEEESSKRRANIRGGFTESSFMIPPINQSDSKIHPGYSVADITQVSQQLYPGISSSSSQTGLNALLTNSKSTGDLSQKHYNSSSQ